MAKNIEPSAPADVNRTERVLIFMIAAIVALSILSFFATLIGTAAGVTDFGVGAWPVVLVLPLIGLPIAFVMFIAFIVISAVRRSRENRSTRR